jgi:hypothetical protein
MTNQIRILVAAALLAGCAQMEQTPSPAPDAAPVQEAAMPAPDETSEARADASPATGDLGLTVASLGTAKEPGLWLKTPLVKVPGRGRLSYAQTGRTIEVDLIPLDAPRGAGSRLSLEGFQALGAPLTGLPELRVTGLGA